MGLQPERHGGSAIRRDSFVLDGCRSRVRAHHMMLGRCAAPHGDAGRRRRADQGISDGRARRPSEGWRQALERPPSATRGLRTALALGRAGAADHAEDAGPLVESRGADDESICSRSCSRNDARASAKAGAAGAGGPGWGDPRGEGLHQRMEAKLAALGPSSLRPWRRCSCQSCCRHAGPRLPGSLASSPALC